MDKTPMPVCEDAELDLCVRLAAAASAAADALRRDARPWLLIDVQMHVDQVIGVLERDDLFTRSPANELDALAHRLRPLIAEGTQERMYGGEEFDDPDCLVMIQDERAEALSRVLQSFDQVRIALRDLSAHLRGVKIRSRLPMF